MEMEMEWDEAWIWMGKYLTIWEGKVGKSIVS